MYKPNIKIVPLFTILLLFITSNLSAQQSDYEIVQEFRATYSELSDRIEIANSSEDFDQINLDVNAFETQYSDHADLINGALYPDTFSGLMNLLKSSYNTSLSNISVIEQLNNRVEILVEEMSVFRNRISTLNQEIISLEEQIDRSETNERQQAALIRQYRLNLDQRDAFVSEFLEDLLARYQNLDSEAQSELSDASDRLQDNPVGILKTIIAEYIQLSDRSTTLELPDYVAMRAQHGYFSNVWDRIGMRLTETFNPDNADLERQEVEDLLAAWIASVDNKLWTSLLNEFNQNGIELRPFTTASEFNQAINTYIDTAYEASLESNRESDYQKYQEFSEFWNNTVKASWGELITTGNILTYSEIAAIDIKLNSWGEASSTTSNLMFILLIVSIAVIVGLVVLLVTKKS